jgi:hypothetical protein
VPDADGFLEHQYANDVVFTTLLRRSDWSCSFGSSKNMMFSWTVCNKTIMHTLQ